MENVDILLTLAETGIVLAGFSGVVLALRPASRPIDTQGRARLVDLLVTALGESMFALFPILLFEAGFGLEETYQLSASSLAIFLVAGTVFMLRGGSGRIGMRSLLMVFPSLLILLLLGLVSFGKLPHAQFFAYFMALFWLLFLACANFFQLVIHHVTEDASEDGGDGEEAGSSEHGGVTGSSEDAVLGDDVDENL